MSILFTSSEKKIIFPAVILNEHHTNSEHAKALIECMYFLYKFWAILYRNLQPNVAMVSSILGGRKN